MIPSRNTRVFVSRNDFGGSVGLLIAEVDATYERGLEPITHRAHSVTMEPHDEGHEMIEPTLRITDKAAGELMGRLWDLGFRPSPEQLQAWDRDALRAHLEDARAISKAALAKLGVKL